MADLVITPANVVAGANAVVKHGKAGAAVTAGQVIYRDPATKKLLLADADSVTAAARVPAGIALHAAALDQPLAFIEEGDINLGATLVVGATYYLSGTAGGIAPAADVSTGEFVTVLGVASAANNLKMKMIVSGAAVP
jgi:hypothetical protein